MPRGGFAWVTGKLKKESAIGIPLCTTNRINMPQTADKILEDGFAVSRTFARDLQAVRTTGPIMILQALSGGRGVLSLK